MSKRNLLPRPVRMTRKMKMCTVEISRNAYRTVRTLAHDFGTSTEVVLGLLVTFEVSRFEKVKH
ncbi:MAG: hypothetical protein AAB375_02925 [Patescibacteria group bacterium]